MDVGHTIGTLASRSGLSQHTIRAWERRYSALSPNRSKSNRRIYTESDIERLSLLKRMVESGHSIGQVAHLPTDQLKLLDRASWSNEKAELRHVGETAQTYLAACLQALEALDPQKLEESLVRGGMTLGMTGLLDGVILPLLTVIETGWLNGSVRISQEHMASAVLRSYLDRARSTIACSVNAPKLIVTTPRDQHHEIGALIVAIVAAMQSWRVSYLGPNLPAGEIVNAVHLSGARAVALSLVYPANDPNLSHELLRLRVELGPATSIVVGGRAAVNYSDVLEQIRARVCLDLVTFREVLDELTL